MWLEDFHVDGLRWDGTVFIRNVDFSGSPEGDLPEGWEMMQDINQEMHEKMPGKISIAEDLQKSDAITESIPEGGCGFNAQWDAAFSPPHPRCPDCLRRRGALPGYSCPRHPASL